MKRILIQIAIVIAMAIPAIGEYQWNDVAPMQIPRMGHCAAVADGKIYVFGGMSIRHMMEPVASVEIFQPDSNRWIPGASLPVAVYQASAVTVGRFIYVFGGLSPNGPNDRMFAYDTKQDTVVSVGDFPAPRRSMGAVNVGGRILMIGGIEGRQQVTRTGFWWDPDSNHWQEAPPLSQPCAGFGLVSNSSVYAVGGMFLGPLSLIEQLIGDHWVQLPHADLPEPRGDIGSSFLNDTLIVVAGGVGPRGAEDEVYGFAPRGHAWRRLPPMSTPRIDFPLVELDGRLYAIGGNSGDAEPPDGLLRSVEVFAEANGVQAGNIRPNLPRGTPLLIWPNPSNGIVNISVQGRGTYLDIFDLSGRRIAFEPIAGTRILAWQANAVPTGSYIAVLRDQAGNQLSVGQVKIAK